MRQQMKFEIRLWGGFDRSVCRERNTHQGFFCIGQRVGCRGGRLVTGGAQYACEVTCHLRLDLLCAAANLVEYRTRNFGCRL